jgi:Putative peptidoglycan binding domain
MKKYLIATCFVLLAAVSAVPNTTRAETTSVTSMMALLESLMKQVADLQKQLVEVKTVLAEELKDGLAEGVTDEDVKEIQELLATDPTIYPKGVVSGYYGPLTKEAVERFQERHDLEVTGVVDAETKALMLEYFKERSGGKIPVGLLRAPGMNEKIKGRYLEHRDEIRAVRCQDTASSTARCKSDDHEDEDEDDSKSNDVKSRDLGVVSSTTVEAALVRAEKSISALEEAIADSTDADRKEDAVRELKKAGLNLQEAKDNLAKGRLRAAFAEAVHADRTATEARFDLIRNTIDSSSDDEDEDEDEDEDDEDEDEDDEDMDEMDDLDV